MAKKLNTGEELELAAYDQEDEPNTTTNGSADSQCRHPKCAPNLPSCPRTVQCEAAAKSGLVDNHTSARGFMDMLRPEGPVCCLRADKPEGSTQGPKALTYP